MKYLSILGSTGSIGTQTLDIAKKNPDKFGITEKPGPHWENVGFGNNMVIKACVLKKIGLFKEWLGPGSISSSAEDAEIINRSLLNNYKI